MKSFIIKTKTDLARALYEIEESPMEPVREVIIKPYQPEKKRTVAQNSLAFLWYRQASYQMKDETPEDKRGYCKLHFGVAILKSGTSSICRHFSEQYDSIIKPLPYEKKRAVMIEPFNLPVTSLFNASQFSEYLEEVDRFFSGVGVILSHPEDLYNLAMGRFQNKQNNT